MAETRTVFVVTIAVLLMMAGTASAKGSHASCANTCNCPDLDSCTNGAAKSTCCWQLAVNPGMRKLLEPDGACKSCDNSEDCADPVTGFCPPADPCVPNPCQNAGTCAKIEGGGFTCTCAPGFMGTLCGTPDPCAGNPCQNGGSCSTVGEPPAAKCSCISPFGGEFCATNLCASMECQNGGSCVTAGDPPAAKCDCIKPFTGQNCQSDYCTDYLQLSCKNGGSCAFIDGNYGCACQKPFTGIDCGSDYCKDAGRECRNGGSCAIDLYGNYICACIKPFSGKTCELGCSQPLDDSKIGGYGGTFPCPVPAPDRAKCLYTCTKGVPIESLSGVPCLNGMWNYDWNGATPACVDCNIDANCPASQPKCETHVCVTDPCAPNPCLNDGTCAKAVDGYTCTCQGGYTGTNCEVAPADPCDPDPCHDGGFCWTDSRGTLCYWWSPFYCTGKSNPACVRGQYCVYKTADRTYFCEDSGMNSK